MCGRENILVQRRVTAEKMDCTPSGWPMESYRSLGHHRHRTCLNLDGQIRTSTQMSLSRLTQIAEVFSEPRFLIRPPVPIQEEHAPKKALDTVIPET